MIGYIIMASVPLLALGGCWTRVDLYDYAGGSKPAISVDSTVALVGQLTEVKVETRFRVDERSRIREEQPFRTEIGICAKEGVLSFEQLDTVAMDCPFDGADDFPDELLLAAPDTPTIIRDAALRRGEEITITHTVRLTSTEPGSFTLFGAFLVGSERGWSSPLIDGEEVIVLTFR